MILPNASSQTVKQMSSFAACSTTAGGVNQPVVERMHEVDLQKPQ